MSRTALLALLTISLALNIASAQPAMQNRWLFVWQDMSNPANVDRMVARFPAAQAAGYNGVAFSPNLPADKAPALREAAAKYGLSLVAIVMGGGRDRNCVEGLPCKDQLFVVRDGAATLAPDNPTKVLNGDFEDATGHHFGGWRLQDDEGVTTFADTAVFHGGKCSLRLESVGKNQYRHCRVMQPVKLQPFRHYRISFWVKTEGFIPADAHAQILDPTTGRSFTFQSFRPQATQDWRRYDLVFNSLDHTGGNFYLGSWGGKDGKLWWDDVSIEEVGLCNVLRRAGCPVTVKGEDGTVYEEGKDYERIADPLLHPWRPFHEEPPLRLAPNSRLKAGDRLRVSYYHSIVVYEERVNWCLSDPKVFDDWRAEVKRADELLHPAAFLMSHDEIRVANWCAGCQAKGMTPGQLLAWNVRQSAKIIRDLRPDAQIWVWSDMFDPLHNAVDHYYAVNGSLQGSWEGLDTDVGIMNWYGQGGKNSPFFAELGLRQMLSGYYDSDENGDQIAQWQAAVKDVPGIVGAMYTTWEDKYGALEAWAQRAWGQ